MSELEVFNWQGLLTEHQVHTWRVIASSDGVSVKTETLIFSEGRRCALVDGV